ncbi:hypothetical protein CGZ90_19965 [Fictibacillus aquaticus]|uniref:Uncharacterized protein n=1 Tax=Fictibacillus aquaticus TaxID=2021314 RepID=A0A235F3Y4_9BACL|nr:hypothetical protein CGZ90_19965 [Fictibacillus aquaticus]
MSIIYNRMKVVIKLFNIYFPEDKTEYLPSLVLLLLAVIFSYLFVFFMKKYSKKEEEKANLFEQQILSAKWKKEE